jgi:hypothetical protein
LYVGKLWAGSVHDITIFKNECSWINFRGKRIHVDLGFQGMKVIICNGCVIMPHKKPKGKLLGAFEKSVNKIFSSFRVKVENALAGCKSFLINQIRSRTKNSEQIVENFQLSAGLYNYKLKFSTA